jgi:hypothetical protein
MEGLPSLSIAGTTCHCGFASARQGGPASEGLSLCFQMSDYLAVQRMGALMIEFITGIVGALAAGAIAKAADIGGRAVGDAYDALRALIVRKLGKGGAVQNIEDEPRSEPAQASLAEALTKAGLGADPELVEHAEALRTAIDSSAGTGGAAIEVGDIFGKVNVLVSNLVASGRIKLGDIRADTGDATLTNLTAGADSRKKV